MHVHTYTYIEVQFVEWEDMEGCVSGTAGSDEVRNMLALQTSQNPLLVTAHIRPTFQGLCNSYSKGTKHTHTHTHSQVDKGAAMQ